MARKRTPPPLQRPVSIRVGEETYFGSYSIVEGQIRVTYGYRTRIEYFDYDDAVSPEEMARKLLHELVVPT